MKEGKKLTLDLYYVQSIHMRMTSTFCPKLKTTDKVRFQNVMASSNKLFFGGYEILNELTVDALAPAKWTVTKICHVLK